MPLVLACYCSIQLPTPRIYCNYLLPHGQHLLEQWLKALLTLILLTNLGVDRAWVGSSHSGLVICSCSQPVAGPETVTKALSLTLMSILGSLKQLGVGLAGASRAPHSQFGISSWSFCVVDTGWVDVLHGSKSSRSECPGRHCRGYTGFSNLILEVSILLVKAAPKTSQA